MSGKKEKKRKHCGCTNRRRVVAASWPPMSATRIPASLSRIWKDIQSQMCVWHDVLWNKFLMHWVLVICGLGAQHLRRRLVFQVCFLVVPRCCTTHYFPWICAARSFISEIYWQMDFQMFCVSFAAGERSRSLLKAELQTFWETYAANNAWMHVVWSSYAVLTKLSRCI